MARPMPRAARAARVGEAIGDQLRIATWPAAALRACLRGGSVRR
jgi:hypothetical protein